MYLTLCTSQISALGYVCTNQGIVSHTNYIMKLQGIAICFVGINPSLMQTKTDILTKNCQLLPSLIVHVPHRYDLSEVERLSGNFSTIEKL